VLRDHNYIILSQVYYSPLQSTLHNVYLTTHWQIKWQRCLPWINVTSLIL